jgi:exodeoxyribonuclease VII small subunit
VTTKPDNLPNLEVSLAELNKLIDTMEHSELSLEQSLTQFERGITLVKHCQKTLEEAEQKVKILIQNNNKEDLTIYPEENKGNDADENAGEK